MVWTAADIPDLRGRVAIVTGASDGIGYAIALELARHGAHVVVASRDERRTAAAAARIADAAPSARVDAKVLDLASLASVRRCAEGVAREHSAVDILVNNAGISGGPRRDTIDGFEAHFQINHLGHFALTGLLLPVLLRARAGARVVSISSEIASSGQIDFDDLQSTRGYGFIKAYAQSKLANLLFAFELERLSRASGATVASFAAHPGVAQSNLLVRKDADWGRSRNVAETLIRVVQVLLAQPAAMGALPALYQATEPSARPEQYVGPKGLVHGRGHPGPVNIPERALAADVARRLWKVSSRLSGVSYEGFGD